MKKSHSSVITWKWCFCKFSSSLSPCQSLITFVNKHLNKLNLEVTELESQVRDFLNKLMEFELTWNDLRYRFFMKYTCVHPSVCPVCWWRVPDIADGTAGRLLCPSVQLLPHPRELWTEGDFTLQQWNQLDNCYQFGTLYVYKVFPLFPLRFTMWRLPLNWCRMEAWRNPRPDQKVFYRQGYIIL